ncbi:MAG: tetrahydrofolate dehydrogenase/cyclohydrolase catalytic domain-containing protein, partial [Monoglobus pectinilyticus]
MAKILSGKIVSARVKDELKKEVEELSQRGKQTGLAVVLVGDDSASKVYVRNKEKACEEVGIYSEVHRLSANTSEEELLKLIN